jgi:hypothetical protein
MSIWPFRFIAVRMPTWRLGSRGFPDSSAEILDLFGHLREAESNLDESFGGLEAQFLTGGSELELLKQSGDRFAHLVEKLVNTAAGKNGAGLGISGCMQLIEEATQFLVGCERQTRLMLETLRDYQSHIGRLLAAQIELQRAMLPLRCVQTLFKVESSPLGGGVQQLFTALTQEMEGLQGQVRDIFSTKFKQLEQTQRTLGKVTVQLEAQACALRQVLETQRVRIESSLEDLKKELATNAQRDAGLQRLGKNLTQEIEQIVMGMQFQDIVNQKLQHVKEALAEIEKNFSENYSDSKGAAERFQIVRQSCLVEAGQLEAVQEELSGAELAIRGGIQKILSSLEEGDSQGLSQLEFQKLTTSCNGAVQVLLEIMEEVRALVASTLANAAAAYEMLAPLGGLTSDLTSHVRTMSVQMRLIGLNSQIQAAKANEHSKAGGLDVLSARTNEISAETNRITEQAAAQLDELAAGLAGSVKAFGKLRVDGLAQQSILEDQGRAGEQELRSLRQSALETLAELEEALTGIKEHGQRALDVLQFGAFYRVTVPALHEALTSIADKAEGWLRSRNFEADHVNRIESFKRSYTMASEHKVFDEVIRGRQSAVAKSRAVESSPDDGATSVTMNVPEVCPITPGAEGMGDNVELF